MRNTNKTTDMLSKVSAAQKQSIIDLASYVKEGLEKTGLHDEGVKFVIAGGAIRDLYFNKTPRDYDFFFYYEDEDSPLSKDEIDDNIVYLSSVLNIVLAEKGREYEKDTFSVYGGFIRARRVDFVYGGHCQTSNPEKIIDKFIIPITQAYYCPYEETFKFSDNFINTVEKGSMALSDRALTKYEKFLIRDISTMSDLRTIDFPIKIEGRKNNKNDSTLSNQRTLLNPRAMPKMFI